MAKRVDVENIRFNIYYDELFVKSRVVNFGFVVVYVVVSFRVKIIPALAG